MNETKSRKMVSRSVAIILGIICIILVVGVIEAFAYYIPMINDKNNMISSLNSQISDMNSQISGLNVTITNLRDTVRDLDDIVNLDKSEEAYNTSWIVPPLQGLDLPVTFVDEDHTPIGFHSLFGRFTYAGYLIVQINSTSNDTYINYTCASHFGTFNLQTDIGLEGTTILPVLPLASDWWSYPSEGIFMTVSTHTAVQAKMNITATYYY